MNAVLEKKLHELVDKQEIWEVLLRYSRGMDRFDKELIRSCYHDDAIDDHHHVIGDPDSFIDSAIALHAQIQTVHHHGISNHSCDLEGDDAHTETYYTFIGKNNAPPHMLSIGRYIDHFQRRDGVWKIRNRVCSVEATFDLLESDGSAVPADYFGDLGEPLPATRDRNDLSYRRPIVPRRPLSAT